MNPPQKNTPVETTSTTDAGPRPSHKPGPPHKPGKLHTLTKTVTIETLRPYFHLTLARAAREFGICITHMKRLCRMCNIKQWPYRQLQKIRLSMEAVKASLTGVGAVDASSSCRKLYEMQLSHLQKRWDCIVENPNVDVKALPSICAGMLDGGKAPKKPKRSRTVSEDVDSDGSSDSMRSGSDGSTSVSSLLSHSKKRSLRKINMTDVTSNTDAVESLTKFLGSFQDEDNPKKGNNFEKLQQIAAAAGQSMAMQGRTSAFSIIPVQSDLKQQSSFQARVLAAAAAEQARQNFMQAIHVSSSTQAKAVTALDEWAHAVTSRAHPSHHYQPTTLHHQGLGVHQPSLQNSFERSMVAHAQARARATAQVQALANLALLQQQQELRAANDPSTSTAELTSISQLLASQMDRSSTVSS